jgi:predicted RNase H-like HicB family nuclease
MELRSYHVLLKRQRGEGFVAKCIELPGCLSEGKTEAEALKNVQEAIKLYLEDVEAEAKEKSQTRSGNSIVA